MFHSQRKLLHNTGKPTVTDSPWNRKGTLLHNDKYPRDCLLVYFFGQFFWILIPTTLLHPNPFQSLQHQVGEKDGWRGKELQTVLDCFLVVKAIRFLGASPISIIRISPTSNPATQQQQKQQQGPTATKAGAVRGTAASQALSRLLHLYLLKSPLDSKHKLSAACKNLSPPRAGDNESQWLWTI